MENGQEEQSNKWGRSLSGDNTAVLSPDLFQLSFARRLLQREIDKRKRCDKITPIKTLLMIRYWLAKSKGSPDHPISHTPVVNALKREIPQRGQTRGEIERER